jgi:hypothetical protein
MGKSSPAAEEGPETTVFQFSTGTDLMGIPQIAHSHPATNPHWVAQASILASIFGTGGQKSKIPGLKKRDLGHPSNLGILLYFTRRNGPTLRPS